MVPRYQKSPKATAVCCSFARRSPRRGSNSVPSFDANAGIRERASQCRFDARRFAPLDVLRPHASTSDPGPFRCARRSGHASSIRGCSAHRRRRRQRQVRIRTPSRDRGPTARGTVVDRVAREFHPSQCWMSHAHSTLAGDMLVLTVCLVPAAGIEPATP